VGGVVAARGAWWSPLSKKNLPKFTISKLKGGKNGRGEERGSLDLDDGWSGLASTVQSRKRGKSLRFRNAFIVKHSGEGKMFQGECVR